MKKYWTFLFLLLVLVLAWAFYAKKERTLLSSATHASPAFKPTKTIPLIPPNPALNENLKDTFNLFFYSSAPYPKEERIEKENDVLMKLSVEIENRIDFSTLVYTFEHSGPKRRCRKVEEQYECFAPVEKNSDNEWRGWKMIFTAPEKNRVHLEKVIWVTQK